MWHIAKLLVSKLMIDALSASFNILNTLFLQYSTYWIIGTAVPFWLNWRFGDFHHNTPSCVVSPKIRLVVCVPIWKQTNLFHVADKYSQTLLDFRPLWPYIISHRHFWWRTQSMANFLFMFCGWPPHHLYDVFLSLRTSLNYLFSPNETLGFRNGVYQKIRFCTIRTKSGSGRNLLQNMIRNKKFY